MPLLVPVIKDGKICCNLPPIHQIQRNASENLSHLPASFKRLKDAESYPVIKSQLLEQKRQETEKKLRNQL